MEGLGGVLMKNYHAIFYESRNLKYNERNYATNDLDLDTLIHLLGMWRHHLIGNIFFLKMENIGLMYLFDKHNLKSQQEDGMNF